MQKAVASCARAFDFEFSGPRAQRTTCIWATSLLEAGRGKEEEEEEEEAARRQSRACGGYLEEDSACDERQGHSTVVPRVC